jgi:hypothetical protein
MGTAITMLAIRQFANKPDVELVPPTKEGIIRFFSIE